ncbi:MAG: ABC transporter permease [Candidatus Cloacimonetes bacterium]|nr:ABC transporter permease [Candidatus Cloacimonadota bacterium]
MIHHYFKTSLRYLIRFKGYTLLNIIGLALGIAVVIIIMLWIIDEFTFDHYNEHFSDIYRVLQEEHRADRTINSAVTPTPLGPLLVEKLPEVLAFSRYGTFVGEVLLRQGERAFFELRGAYVDPDFFDIFTLPVLMGKKESFFPDRFSVVITRSMAAKYFGSEEAYGKIILLENFCELTVTGIIEDVPEHSHLQFDFLVPFELYDQWGVDLQDWANAWSYTYLLLDEEVDITEMEFKINKLQETFNPEQKNEFYLQPLGKIHLFSNLYGDYPAVLGDIKYIYIFGFIAFFILIIACINFINLATACSLKRAREVGLRKIMGSSRKQLVTQFLLETIIISCIALLLALVLVELFLPFFRILSRKDLSLELVNPYAILLLISITLITGLLAGSYPAFFISGYSPGITIKGKQNSGKGRYGLRRFLVIFQFIISISLLICTGVVYGQLDYIRNKDLGFDSDYIVRLQCRPGLYRTYETFKERLLKNPDIINVTSTGWLEQPVNMPEEAVNWEGKAAEQTVSINGQYIGFDYFRTLNIDILQGRTFSREISSDVTSAFIINESALRVMGFASPLGKRISLYGKEGEIIGVVRDYHAHSLHQEIKPLIITINDQSYPVYIYIKINPERIRGSISFINEEWDRIIPDFPFEYHFLDEMLNDYYKNENQIGMIFGFFAILAIIVSCLGLFGLATFATESRAKEIGMRKVVGASVTTLIWLLSRQFARWTLIASVFAWIGAYFVMKNWLNNFAYKTDLDPLLFVAATSFSLFIALVSVSFHTLKAATANPVKVLKYE